MTVQCVSSWIPHSATTVSLSKPKSQWGFVPGKMMTDMKSNGKSVQIWTDLLSQEGRSSQAKDLHSLKGTSSQAIRPGTGGPVQPNPLEPDDGRKLLDRIRRVSATLTSVSPRGAVQGSAPNMPRTNPIHRTEDFANLENRSTQLGSATSTTDAHHVSSNPAE